MARTITTAPPQPTAEELEQAYKDGRRGKECGKHIATEALYAQWNRGNAKWRAIVDSEPDEFVPNPLVEEDNGKGYDCPDICIDDCAACGEIEKDTAPKPRRRLPPGCGIEHDSQVEYPDCKTEPAVRKSRRTVAPGEPPKRYSGHEWPRGGHVRMNNEDESEYCWAKKGKFQADGAEWVSTACCVSCIDKKGCAAWRAYRKHLAEEYGQ